VARDEGITQAAAGNVGIRNGRLSGAGGLKVETFSAAWTIGGDLYAKKH
jgi:hypothetical protein